MTNQTLKHTFIPELGTPKKGKVREIYENNGNLLMIASDRISVFDKILNETVSQKGEILTGISRFWFEQTQDICQNHILSFPDPNIMLVKKCTPLKVEVIVRGYLVGSLARDYAAGKKQKCGITLPDGLKPNDPLPSPIITPTTKEDEGHDQDITVKELVDQKIVTQKQWKEIEEKALKLFARGQKIANERGLVLLDTKYEFGLDETGHIILIDEVHTPDSSRFFIKGDKELKFPDKELARQWVSQNGFHLSEEILQKVQKGYREIYELITRKPLERENPYPSRRVLKSLKEMALIRGCFVLVMAGSEKDKPHVDKITSGLEAQKIPNKVIYSSAHKNPKEVLELLDLYNDSLEPVVAITVAGRSNALSGVAAANLKWPVIACPPFKDQSDYLVNIHSSIQMPSLVPAMTVIDPSNAALAAGKILATMELCQ